MAPENSVPHHLGSGCDTGIWVRTHFFTADKCVPSPIRGMFTVKHHEECNVPLMVSYTLISPAPRTTLVFVHPFIDLRGALVKVRLYMWNVLWEYSSFQLGVTSTLNLSDLCFGQKEDNSNSQVSKLREKLQLISALTNKPESNRPPETAEEGEQQAGFWIFHAGLGSLPPTQGVGTVSPALMKPSE